jgi:hypothetical protein
MTYIVEGGLGRDSAYHDAFDRLRVSQPVGLFDSQHQYDASLLFWVEKTTGTASSAHDPTNASVDLTVGTAANDEIIRQTRQYHRYQPGKSQLVLMTFDLGTLAGNHLRARIGYFDTNNGIFLQQYNGTTSIVQRNNTSDANAIPQSSWNIDAFNGTGPSGITLDMTKAQILVMDLEWLGVGRVRVGFVVDGIIYYAHQFLHSNRNAGVYMETANLPIRVEFTNVGSGTGDTISQICASVISEGGFELERGIPFSVSTGITAQSVGTTRYPVMSVRPKTSFNSIENRGTILPFEFDALVASQDVLVELVYNGSLTNASFASVDTSSITEYDVAATAISGGQVIASKFVAAGGVGAGRPAGTSGGNLLARLPLTLDVDGANPIPLSVCATAFTSTANVSVALLWQEYR